MTWPFENDTSAIVKKLAGRSMQADKRNKAFLLLTIAISVCMVFSILLISTGTQAKNSTACLISCSLSVALVHISCSLLTPTAGRRPCWGTELNRVTSTPCRQLQIPAS